MERLFFSDDAQTAFAVGQARGVVLLVAALHNMEMREATPNEVKVATAGHGSSSKEQVQRMVQAILGLPDLPQPDDAADALAIAICVANRERSVSRIPTGSLDRSALKPATNGITPYEKAVREALRRERLGVGTAEHSTRQTRVQRGFVGTGVIASLDGLVSAVFADSLILEVRWHRLSRVRRAVPSGSRSGRGADQLFAHHLVREDAQARHRLRTPEELGFFGLLLTVTGVGPKVALAISGSRAIGDLQLAILSDDQALLTAVPGVGKRLAARICLELKEKVDAAGVAAGASLGSPAGEPEVVAALLALGYSVGEARQASREALANPAVGPRLEDRVKAALRALL